MMKLISPDPDNKMFELAVQYVNDTDRNLFITGKAGTGKTTFLKYIKNNCPKQMVIVAPTGVAAINAGGVTAHSFFQLPLAPFIPDKVSSVNGREVYNRHSLAGKLKLNNEKRKVIEQLEVLVIDEISMMCADTLDAIDAVLRHVRHRHREPFGGVQMILIGDLYQLQPVVTDQEWSILSKFYSSPFFFDSIAWKERDAHMIEFNKIYRQSDPEFINLLNAVRNNDMSEDDFRKLNGLYRPVIEDTSGYIMLTTHNARAEFINNTELNKLKTPLHIFSAEIKGEFNERSYPAEKELKLRVGAQVMFTRNDSTGAKKYFNGKIGTLSRITNDCIYVQCEDGEVAVPKETWENIRYTFDEASHRLKEEEIGSFTQYPLKTAWAITIHKSQGLTFDKVIIDAGEAFVAGQVYVALSRCTNLEGIILKSIIRPRVITTDERIEKGIDKTNEHELRGMLSIAAREYHSRALSSVFDTVIMDKRISELAKYVHANAKHFHGRSFEWINHLHAIYLENEDRLLKLQIDVTSAFGMDLNDEQFRQLTSESALKFIDIIKPILFELSTCALITSNKLHSKEINKSIKDLYHHIDWMLHIAKAVSGGWAIDAWQKSKISYRKPYFNFNSYVGKRNDQNIEIQHPMLYAKLKKLRDQICDSRGVPEYLVANSQTLANLTQYLPQTRDQLLKISGFGSARVSQYGDKFLAVINDYVNLNNIDPPAIIPEKREKKHDAYQKNASTEITWNMFSEGKSIDEIAALRGLVRSTIEGHLLPYIKTKELEVGRLVPATNLEIIENALRTHQGKTLTEIRMALNDAFSFNEMRYVIAAMEEKEDLSSHVNH